MEHSGLRPEPTPGRDPGSATVPGPYPEAGPEPCPCTGRERRRRVTGVLCGLLAAAVLLLAGVGLGTLGVTHTGLRGPEHRAAAPAAGPPESAEAAGATGLPGPPADARAAVTPPGTPAPAATAAALGVEVVDDERPGALVVGVHVPGPGHSAGLVRGDVLLTLGGDRIDTAADLAHAVARARPGDEVTLTVRRPSGVYQQVRAVPGVIV
ncbi:PDZ domain-containing protein [Streptomyces sp. NPDC052077]|uniref:PDZ domain-containing protein n=1 Tax=Streptomyces sp. NPDC052077 TaxID=3154757 RepID=UPI003414B943